MNKILTTEENKTIEYYDQNAVEWSEKHSGGTMFDQDMKELFNLVPSGRVLEIGVGGGEDAIKLIKYYGDKNYCGVEPAKGLIKRARERNPQASFIQKTIYDMDFPRNSFDVFWVCAMLIHIPKSRLNEALTKIGDCAVDKACGFISVMEGNFDMEESRPGRFYSLWSPEEFERELIKANFSIYSKRRIVPEKGSPWLAYILNFC